MYMYLQSAAIFLFLILKTFHIYDFIVINVCIIVVNVSEGRLTEVSTHCERTLYQIK